MDDNPLGTAAGRQIIEAGKTLYRSGVEDGIEKERVRLRPLLTQCEALALAQLHLNQRLPRPDAKVIALFEDLLANIRRETGVEGTETEEPPRG